MVEVKEVKMEKMKCSIFIIFYKDKNGIWNINFFGKLGREGNFFNFIKSIYRIENIFYFRMLKIFFLGLKN